MGLVQQEWVGQSRGKMPLPRFYWQPWERHLAATLTNPFLPDKPHRIPHGSYGSRLSQCHWTKGRARFGTNQKAPWQQKMVKCVIVKTPDRSSLNRPRRSGVRP